MTLFFFEREILFSTQEIALQENGKHIADLKTTRNKYFSLGKHLLGILHDKVRRIKKIFSLFCFRWPRILQLYLPETCKQVLALSKYYFDPLEVKKLLCQKSMTFLAT